MTDPKVNTVKYLIALGAYQEAVELLGWPPPLVQSPYSYLRVPGESLDEARYKAVSAGFEIRKSPTGGNFRSGDFVGSWVVPVK